MGFPNASHGSVPQYFPSLENVDIANKLVINQLFTNKTGTAQTLGTLNICINNNSFMGSKGEEYALKNKIIVATLFM